jgi:hypothetical protein
MLRKPAKPTLGAEVIPEPSPPPEPCTCDSVGIVICDRCWNSWIGDMAAENVPDAPPFARGHKITIDVPDALYGRLAAAAKQQHVQVEDVALDALTEWAGRKQR